MPCAAALDFLAEAYVRDGGEGVQKAVALWKSLANEHDTIRKKSVSDYQPEYMYTDLIAPVCRYWEYRIKETLMSSSS